MRTCIHCFNEIAPSRHIDALYCTPECRRAAKRVRFPYTPKPRLPRDQKLCAIETCKNNHYARGWCSMHWNRFRRYGDPMVSYPSAHYKVRQLRGRAAEHKCERCWRPQADVWAYTHTAVVEYRTENGAPFSMDSSDYSPLCDNCHTALDRSHGKVEGGNAHRRQRRDIPHTLLSKATWTRADGKRPIQIDGCPASSTNKSTWSTFQAVSKSTAGDGFGIMLGDGVGAYDLDHVLDQDTLEAWAAEFVQEIAEPIIFIERSVSGTGLHIFVETMAQRGWRRDGVEFYPRSRFIRMTGNRFSLT